MKLTASVPPDKAFWLQDGSAVKSLQQLIRNIADKGDNIYYHHVTADHNDFANWIEGVFKNKTLAASLRKASSKQELLKILEESVQQSQLTKVSAKVTRKKRRAPEKMLLIDAPKPTYPALLEAPSAKKRLYTIPGTVGAVLVLIAVIGVMNPGNGNSVTGAVVAQTSSGTGVFGIAVLGVLIGTLVAIVQYMRQKHEH